MIRRILGSILCTAKQVQINPSLLKQHRVPFYGGVVHYWVSLVASYTYKIRLDKGLAFNVSIHNLYLPLIGYSCSKGYVKLQILHSHFCGFYSGVHVYMSTRTPEMQIVLKTTAKLPFWLEFEFSVTDKELTSCVLRRHDQTDLPNPPFSVFQHFNTWTHRGLRMYFLQARKFQNMILKFSLQVLPEHQFHDGPGDLSPKVEMKNRILKSSSFQGVLVLYLTHDLVTRSLCLLRAKQLVQFSFLGLLAQNVHHVTPRENPEISVNSSTFSPEMLLLRTAVGWQINVTVAWMSYMRQKHSPGTQEIDSVTCKYAGLLVVEEFNGRFQESSTFCENFNKQKENRRSFYTYNSSLRVILYWYKEYAAICCED